MFFSQKNRGRQRGREARTHRDRHDPNCHSDFELYFFLIGWYFYEMLNVCATESQNRRFVEGISRTSTMHFRIMFQESFPHIKSEVMTWALCQWNAVIHTPLLEPHTHQRWCSQPDGKAIQIWIDQHSCICVIIWNYTEKCIWVLILICNSRKKLQH